MRKSLGSALITTKIAVLFLGSAAPGGNNIIDGLLQYQLKHKNAQIVGFVKGVEGVYSESLLSITEESFAAYRNTGGYDYLSRTKERLEAKDM
jgi:6-phosphofructokinase